MKLIKYRDSGTGNQYTYFWVNKTNNVISPYFDSEKEAIDYVLEKEASEERGLEVKPEKEGH